MLRYLSRLRGHFNRYGDYIPLPSSSARGSVSANSSTPISEEKHRSSLTLSYQLHTCARWMCHFLPPPKTLLSIILCFFLGHFATNWLFGSSSSSILSVSLISDDNYHHIFTISDLNNIAASRDVLPIKVYEAFTDECVEEWVVHHTWGSKCKGTDLSEGSKVDGVWAWVNGSDPAQIAARNTYRPSQAINVDASHRYADHNELLYSMRSAYASFGPDVMTKMHIMASAYPLDNSELSGQVPAWLKLSANASATSNIVLHHDAEYFRPMDRLSTIWQTTQSEEWHANTIPSFNSLAVESQLFNLDSNDADQLVYYNDDFFTMTRNSAADVTSPFFGPVLKTDTRPISFYWPSEKPFQRLWNPAGEEVGIKRAGWVLGQRFSPRTLPYITHHPRSLWLPLLKEAAQTFPDAFSNTALARFRAQKEVPTSIQAFFLASWYIVERHREALLWTWTVAKWGGLKEVMTTQIKADMWEELVDSQDASILAQDSLKVRQPVRVSPDNTEAFRESGIEPPKNTQYSFSSKDGHGLSFLNWSWFWQRSRNGYPDLSNTDGKASHARDFSSLSPEACRISKQTCLRPEVQESSNDFFRRIAFGRAECGDCMIAALMAASGQEGIDKFMPPQHAVVRIPANFDNVGSRAHLPLTERWQSTNFSLSEVFPADDALPAKTISLRTWTARLIQRYQYVLGSTPSTFYKVEKASRLPGQLDDVERTLDTSTPTTFLCLNDDIKEDEHGTETINHILKDWFQSRWPTKMPDEI